VISRGCTRGPGQKRYPAGPPSIAGISAAGFDDRRPEGHDDQVDRGSAAGCLQVPPKRDRLVAKPVEVYQHSKPKIEGRYHA
jgi:hypothetical protein